MLPAFIIYFREGFEASLILSILLAAVRHLGMPQQARAIWMGVILAIVGALAGGVIIYFAVRQYEGTTFQVIFETATFLVAVTVLTMMTFWMQKHSRTLKTELSTKVASAGAGGFALGLIAFTAVGREATESAFFTLAFAFQVNGWLLLLGGVLGLLASIGLSFLVYRLGYRLDYRLFFRVMGILLLVFAAALLSNAIQNIQELGWITVGTTAIWNTARFLSEDSALGDLLHGLVGYAEAPTILQSSLFVVYLLIFGGLFIRLTRKPGTPQVARATTTSRDVSTSHS